MPRIERNIKSTMKERLFKAEQIFKGNGLLVQIQVLYGQNFPILFFSQAPNAMSNRPDGGHRYAIAAEFATADCRKVL
jgi:hypothetical protein